MKCGPYVIQHDSLSTSEEWSFELSGYRFNVGTKSVFAKDSLLISPRLEEWSYVLEEIAGFITKYGNIKASKLPSCILTSHSFLLPGLSTGDPSFVYTVELNSLVAYIEQGSKVVYGEDLHLSL